MGWRSAGFITCITQRYSSWRWARSWTCVFFHLNSGCTFSSFCQLKNEVYKILDILMLTLWTKLFYLDGGFVEQQVWTLIFVYHVIAVVLNLRDFAVMAQTIGVGFRNAKFEEISKPDIPESVLPTIQRWMDRCFF